MIAFHGEPSLKAAVMDRLREHRRIDQITQGIYFQDGRGCHLGCITHVNDGAHEAAERLFGIELRIGYWLEAVFENLPQEDCATWVIESTEAIPCGADLSKCHHHFGVWLLGDSGLLTISDVNRDAIEQVRLLHRRAAEGGSVADEEWSAAESAAWSAAESAAESDAWSAAESDAWSDESVRSAAWRKIAAKSIEIFRAAPVPAGQPAIETCVKSELCAKRLWCPDGELVKVSGGVACGTRRGSIST